MTVAINGVDKQGVSVNGVQVKQALDAANETVDKGVYDPTTLSAVDADLAPGNIADGVTIFGFAGTVVEGGTETIDEDNGTLAASATYTPGDSGIFTGGGSYGSALGNNTVEYLSDGNTIWYSVSGNIITAITAIGDGSRFRLKNSAGGDQPYLLFRHYISTGTYEVDSNADLGAGTSYTPATTGFFAVTTEDRFNCWLEINVPTDGWVRLQEVTKNDFNPLAITIGEGAKLRVNNSAGSAKYYVLMRAKMT